MTTIPIPSDLTAIYVRVCKKNLECDVGLGAAGCSWYYTNDDVYISEETAADPISALAECLEKK